MSTPRILLVDDQRDILRLLHATLDTLGHKLDVYEAPSGEEALLETTRHRFDLLVSDYKLPGITGVELLKKVRAKNPDVKFILISAMTDRRTRDDMLSAGAMAIFDKPIPLADFLDTVERALELKRTILPPEKEKEEFDQSSIAGLLTALRQKVNAQAVYLISERGRMLERAGDLYDSSMVVSLLSSIMAIFAASQKVSQFIHQEEPRHYHVFSGGDHDMVLVPVDALYGLMVAGENLAASGHIQKVVEAMLLARDALKVSLKMMGVPTTLAEQESPIPVPAGVSAATNVKTQVLVDNVFEPKKKPVHASDADAFWEDAVEKHGNPPLHPDVLSYEQAKQLGLTPKGMTGKLKPKK